MPPNPSPARWHTGTGESGLHPCNVYRNGSFEFRCDSEERAQTIAELLNASSPVSPIELRFDAEAVERLYGLDKLAARLEALADWLEKR